MKFLLKYPILFKAFNVVIGTEKTSRMLIDNYIQPKEGMKLLDIGCGMGKIAGRMPQVKYTGVDISELYIASARKHYPHAEFIVGNAVNVLLPEQHFERVIMLGVLHHLNDEEAGIIIQRISKLLSPGGRAIFLEPCFVDNQHFFARWMLKNDRGQYVRNQAGYELLLRPHFPILNVTFHHALLRIPYTHAIFEGRKE